MDAKGVTMKIWSEENWYRWKQWQKVWLPEKRRENENYKSDVETHGNDKKMRLMDIEELIVGMYEQDNVDINTIGELRLL